MSDFDATAAAADRGPGQPEAGPDADARAFLDEVDRAAERLRRLPLTEIVPETPYSPEWPERAS